MLSFPVVVPMRRPELQRDRLLPSLASARPRPAEVIIVDDGCVPPAAETLAVSGEVRILRLTEQGGPARARNAGARASAGESLVFLDDDVIVPADLFSRPSLSFADPGVRAVTGTFSRDSFHRNFCCHGAAAVTETLLTAVCAVRREAFFEAGGFDEAILAATVEDVDLGRRLSRDAASVRFDPDFRVVHLKHYAPVGLIRSHFVRSRDMARYLRDRGLSGMLAELGASQDRLSLPWQFAAGVVLMAAALVLTGAGLLQGSRPALAAALLAPLLAVILNQPFLPFVAARHGSWIAVATAPVLLTEFAVSVVASGWVLVSMPFSRRS